MAVTKEKLVEVIYGEAQIRSFTTKQYVDSVLKALDIAEDKVKYDDLTDILRKYKQSGRNLEFTVNSVYSLLSQNTYILECSRVATLKINI